MIQVTKTFLPPIDEYIAVLKPAWEKAWITNNGDLLQLLEAKLRELLAVKHFYLTNNGTASLLMAIKAMNLTKEIITTPYSYVATLNSILWQGCTPVFVDINPLTFTIDADKIAEAVTDDTEAILATHVYGLPCAVEKIEAIAKAHDLKTIYDGAHAFGSTYKQESLLAYGDISICSFHATKIFHTAEGGGIICNDDTIATTVKLLRSFGHINDEYFSTGINGKNSELHAAMGLSVLPYLPQLIKANRMIFERYKAGLEFSNLQLINPDHQDFEWNYSYCPVLLHSHETMMNVKAALNEADIFPRRYFYPSLNELSFLNSKTKCPVSEDISSRVLSLPMYHGLELSEVDYIVSIIKENL